MQCSTQKRKVYTCSCCRLLGSFRRGLARGRVDGQRLRVERFRAGIILADAVVGDVRGVLVLRQLRYDAESRGSPTAGGEHLGHAAKRKLLLAVVNLWKVVEGEIEE